MIRTALIVPFLLIALSAKAQNPPPSATDVTHTDIQRFIAALPPGVVTDKAIRIVDVGGYHVGVFGVFRPHGISQRAVMHQTKVTEIYYILSGKATLVTGGTLPNPKPLAPGSTSLQSPTIEGGVSREVTSGDVIIIPPKTPHWFSGQEGDLTYLIFRPDPGSELPLK
jgi:mannose-6-phosphate isomerase-like protein (cupin superfamily)